MATEDYLKHTANKNSPPSASLGDEWYNTSNNLLYKRLVVNGQTVTWMGVLTENSSNANAQFNSIGIGTAPSGTTGEIRATNEVTAYFSDAKLKTFEGVIENPIEKIMQISGYYFRENELAKTLGYKNDKRQVGVSAQEIENILPEAVTSAPISSEFKTVKYEKLIPLLIEAIKTQQSQLDEIFTILNTSQTLKK